jgi:hypothetical protein
MPDRFDSLLVLALVLLFGCTPYVIEDELEIPEHIELEPLYAEPLPAVEAEAEPDAVEADPDADATSEPDDPASEQSLAEVCKKAVRKARKDFARGSMHFDSWGLPAPCARDYWDLLVEWYGTHTHHHGCVKYEEPKEVTESRRCYVVEVNRLVLEKHGADAYERAWEEAKHCDWESPLDEPL